MTASPYRLEPDPRPTIGVIVLQSDETLEDEFRRLIPQTARWLASRVPSSTEVSLSSLGDMASALTQAAALLPRGMRFDAIGYGCTSGAATIGVDRVADRVTAGAPTRAVADPASSLIAACRAMGLRRLAVLSPYVAEVSAQLRRVLAEAGVETPVFGSFEEATESAVAQISQRSTHDAAVRLVRDAAEDVDALFLSCTNLRTIDIIAPLEAELGLPVLSSNQALAWRLLQAAGAEPARDAPGALFATLRVGAPVA